MHFLFYLSFLISVFSRSAPAPTPSLHLQLLLQLLPPPPRLIFSCGVFGFTKIIIIIINIIRTAVVRISINTILFLITSPPSSSSPPSLSTLLYLPYRLLLIASHIASSLLLPHLLPYRLLLASLTSAQ